MKKVAISYRGLFNYKKYYKEGLYQEYFSEIENALNNHKKMMHSYFDDCEIDIQRTIQMVSSCCII